MTEIKIQDHRVVVIKKDKVVAKSHLIEDDNKLQELFKRVVAYEEQKYFKKIKKMKL